MPAAIRSPKPAEPWSIKCLGLPAATSWERLGTLFGPDHPGFQTSAALRARSVFREPRPTTFSLALSILGHLAAFPQQQLSKRLL
jgi:hypothetical protein